MAQNDRAGEPLELREVARGCRLSLVEAVAKQLGPLDERHLNALLEVPRERFVRPEDVPLSADDTRLSLDGPGQATISAPHAYLLSFRVLRLEPGDSLVELGTGSGYGAALAAAIVGPEGRGRQTEAYPPLWRGTGSGYGAALAAAIVGPKGRVLTIEIDPALSRWARSTLRDEANVIVVDG